MCTVSTVLFKRMPSRKVKMLLFFVCWLWFDLIVSFIVQLH